MRARPAARKRAPSGRTPARRVPALWVRLVLPGRAAAAIALPASARPVRSGLASPSTAPPSPPATSAVAPSRERTFPAWRGGSATSLAPTSPAPR